MLVSLFLNKKWAQVSPELVAPALTAALVKEPLPRQPSATADGLAPVSLRLTARRLHQLKPPRWLQLGEAVPEVHQHASRPVHRAETNSVRPD